MNVIRIEKRVDEAWAMEVRLDNLADIVAFAQPHIVTVQFATEMASSLVVVTDPRSEEVEDISLNFGDYLIMTVNPETSEMSLSKATAEEFELNYTATQYETEQTEEV